MLFSGVNLLSDSKFLVQDELIHIDKAARVSCESIQKVSLPFFFINNFLLQLFLKFFKDFFKTYFVS
jgi:hypothetical protein